MTDTQADLTHALRFAIKLAEAEGYSECAAGLRAVLAHLERTQPADAQADLTERARNLVRAIEFHLMRTDGDGDYPESTKAAIAALQSDREAAAAEARKAALEEAALLILDCNTLRGDKLADILATGIRALASQEDKRGD